ncbi:hypothetical protein RhiJN_25819 [Ceratobasidium sp. AG-Ba]|nr:hypothetical protein RhiJN_25819 [Ceratobasidium sp. AG-Ba]
MLLKNLPSPWLFTSLLAYLEPRLTTSHATSLPDNANPNPKDDNTGDENQTTTAHKKKIMVSSLKKRKVARVEPDHEESIEIEEPATRQKKPN